MPFTSNRLSIVGKSDDISKGNGSTIQDLSEEWSLLDERIRKINEKHDRLLSSQDKSDSADIELFKVLLEVEQEQLKLLERIAQVPADNIQDVIAKLEIWKRIVIPTGVAEAECDPMHHLVHSTLVDLQEFRDRGTPALSQHS